MCRSGRYRILGEGGWVRASSHIFYAYSVWEGECVHAAWEAILGVRGRRFWARGTHTREDILGARCSGRARRCTKKLLHYNNRDRDVYSKNPCFTFSFVYNCNIYHSLCLSLIYVSFHLKDTQENSAERQNLSTIQVQVTACGVCIPRSYKGEMIQPGVVSCIWLTFVDANT